MLALVREEEFPPAEELNIELKPCPITEYVISIPISMGATINLGNYESARIEVGLTLLATADKAKEALEFGKKWVEEKLNWLVNKTRRARR